MTLRPPRGLGGSGRAASETPEDALRAEVLAEQAATLGQAGRRLERALAALATHDAADCQAAMNRDALVDEAAEAAWHMTIQRDVMRLGSQADLIRRYGIPRAVVNRMGATRRKR